MGSAQPTPSVWAFRHSPTYGRLWRPIPFRFSCIRCSRGLRSPANRENFPSLPRSIIGAETSVIGPGSEYSTNRSELARGQGGMKKSIGIHTEILITTRPPLNSGDKGLFRILVHHIEVLPVRVIPFLVECALVGPPVPWCIGIRGRVSFVRGRWRGSVEAVAVNVRSGRPSGHTARLFIDVCQIVAIKAAARVVRSVRRGRQRPRGVIVAIILLSGHVGERWGERGRVRPPILKWGSSRRQVPQPQSSLAPLSRMINRSPQRPQ